MTAPALRQGWTTGACAAAAAAAACRALLTGHFPDPVTVALPRRRQACFPLACRSRVGDTATAGIVKDAGDDPDITHGVTVCATLRAGPAGAGIVFRAGRGVGRVTRPGLALAVGEPAINPRPRVLIARTLAGIAAAASRPADFSVTLSIPGGEALAARTANPRLGIVGGLSILGTSGIVIPYSCAAWLASIRQAVDVARAGGRPHLVAATGRVSERAALALHGLPDDVSVGMGDFCGATLGYVARHPVPRLTLAGGFAKTGKLAAGHRDLHSSRSQVDLVGLRALLRRLGASPAVLAAAARAGGAGEILALAGDLPLAQHIAVQARGVARAILAGETDVDVLVVARDGQVLAHATGRDG